MSRNAAILAIAAAAAAGIALVLYATTVGIGTAGDSAIYLMSARNLLAGKGLAIDSGDGGRLIPMAGFPPLLPVVLAGLGRAGIDPLAGARWINAVLLAASIVLMAAIVRRLTASWASAALGAVLTLVAVDVLQVHCNLLSEPLFLFCVLAGLLAAAVYSTRPKFWLLLLFSAAFGLAGAARYTGISLVPVGAGAILFAAAPLRRRVAHMAAFAAIFGAPVLFWMTRNLVRTGHIWEQTAAFHPRGWHSAVISYQGLATFLLPSSVPMALRSIALAAAIALIVLSPARRAGLQAGHCGSPAGLPAPTLLLTFIASYLFVFAIAQTFLDAQAYLYGRHLLPLYLAGAALAIHRARQYGARAGVRPRILLIAAGLAMVAVGAGRTAVAATRHHREGIGYSRVQWRNSELIRKVKDLDAAVPLVSNSPLAIYLTTGRTALGIPLRVDPKSLRTRADYAVRIARLRQRLDEGAVMVLLGQSKLPAGVEGEFGVVTVLTTADGSLLLKSRALADAGGSAAVKIP